MVTHNVPLFQKHFKQALKLLETDVTMPQMNWKAVLQDVSKLGTLLTFLLFFVHLVQCSYRVVQKTRQFALP